MIVSRNVDIIFFGAFGVYFSGCVKKKIKIYSGVVFFLVCSTVESRHEKELCGIQQIYLSLISYIEFDIIIGNLVKNKNA